MLSEICWWLQFIPNLWEFIYVCWYSKYLSFFLILKSIEIVFCWWCGRGVILYVYTFFILSLIKTVICLHCICNINLYRKHTKSGTYEHKQNLELYIETKQTTSILRVEVHEEWLFGFCYSEFLLIIVKSRVMIKSAKFL